MDKPMLLELFFSCEQCSHCILFRGKDGEPSDSKEFTSAYIRKHILGANDSSKVKRLRCSKLINIHDKFFGASVDNITEYIIYFVIPPNITVTDDLFHRLMMDENSIIGDSILRVALTKEINGGLKIKVKIDGTSDDDRCQQIEELVENYFIWEFVPTEFKDLKDHFRGINTMDITDIITNNFRDDSFYPILMKEYHIYAANPSKYENLIKQRFDYNWFIENFFPTRIRELEAFYPTWMLVLPSEWLKGIGGVNRVYGKVKGGKTTLVGNRFVTKSCGRETIEDLITQYYAGRLPLTYEESLLSEKTTIGITRTIVNGTKKVTFAL